MQKLLIYRPWWFRGHGYDESKLLIPPPREDAAPLMCCLGQLAVACGIPTDDLAHHATPDDVREPDDVEKWPKPLLKPVISCPVDRPRMINTNLTRELMRLNDDISLTDEEREGLLIRGLAAAGVDVEFTDVLPDYLKEAFPNSCKS